MIRNLRFDHVVLHAGQVHRLKDIITGDISDILCLGTGRQPRHAKIFVAIAFENGIMRIEKAATDFGLLYAKEQVIQWDSLEEYLSWNKYHAAGPQNEPVHTCVNKNIIREERIEASMKLASFTGIHFETLMGFTDKELIIVRDTAASISREMQKTDKK